MSAIELLDLVHDRESFLDFAQALADERREAEEIELSQPENYKWGAGALGWYNTCISQFIEAAMSHFEPDAEGPVIEHVTWKDLAEFLYSGKIIE
jgi:hypothetical protein